MIAMPQRRSVAERIARAADRCLRNACSVHFRLVPLGSVARVVSGGTPDTGNPSFWDGDIVWITPKDLGRPRHIEITSSERRITAEGSSRSSAKPLPVGTVLLSSRAPIGYLGISAIPLATNQGCKNILCSLELNNRFLFHVLRGSIEELEASGRGNTFAEIPAKVVQEISVPLPPLGVQAAVADFLGVVKEQLPELRVYVQAG